MEDIVPLARDVFGLIDTSEQLARFGLLVGIDYCCWQSYCNYAKDLLRQSVLLAVQECLR